VVLDGYAKGWITPTGSESLRAVTIMLLAGSNVPLASEREQQRSELCHALRPIRPPGSPGGRGAGAPFLPLGAAPAVTPPPLPSG
jgi:hypothetical protein